MATVNVLMVSGPVAEELIDARLRVEMVGNIRLNAGLGMVNCIGLLVCGLDVAVDNLKHVRKLYDSINRLDMMVMLLYSSVRLLFSLCLKGLKLFFKK